MSHPTVPVMVRIALIVAFTLGLEPMVHNIKVAPAAFMLALITEFALGALIGMAASILYDAAAGAGKALDNFVGVNTANPAAGVAGEGFGKLWDVVFLAAFFIMGGYRVTLVALSDSFSTVPLGGVITMASLKAFALMLPTYSLRGAVLVAGPAIVIGVTTQIALGTIMRLVRGIQDQSLSFSLVFAGVLFVTIVSLPFMLPTAAHPWIPLHLEAARTP